MNVNFWNISTKETFDKMIEHLKSVNIHELTVQDLSNFKQRIKFEKYSMYNVLFIRELTYKVKYIQKCIIFNNTEINLVYNSELPEIKEIQKLNISEYELEWIIWRFIRLNIVQIDIFLDEHKKEISILEDKICSDINYYGKDIFALKKIFADYEIEIEDFFYMIKNLENSNITAYYDDLLDHAQRLKNKIGKITNSLDSLILLDNDTSNSKTNEINKILTMIATAFVPPTFICSVYGMNFMMPELTSKYSYPIFWIFTISWFVFIFLYFKRKKWL